jgi:hypothetical protein
MRVITYDPMLQLLYGHNVAVSSLLEREAHRRGFESVTFAHTDLPQEAAIQVCRRECTSAIYSQWHEHSPSTGLFMYARESFVIERDLDRLLGTSFLRSGDVVVMHTAMYEHLLGVLEWFSRCEVSIKLRLVFQFPPSGRGSKESRMGEILAQYALSLWEQCDRDVRFFTDNDELAQYLSSFSKVRFSVAPVALDFMDVGAVPTAHSSSRVGYSWVFPGEGRFEKGVDLLAPAWLSHQERFPDDVLFVDASLFEGRLKGEFGSSEVNVRGFDGPMTGYSHFAHLSSADFVLAPYSPVEYRVRTAHIPLEALGMARPLVTTAGTWIARELESLPGKAGVCASEWTANGLANAMAEARLGASELGECARIVAPIVRDRCNVARFFDALVLSSPS